MLTFPEPLEGNVVLSADHKAVVTKEIEKTMFGLHTVLQQVKAEDLSRQLAYSVLYLTEAMLSRVCKLTGIETDTAVEKEERNAKVRAANFKIRELELEVGRQVGGLAISQALKAYSRRLRQWWELRGLGYCSELTYSEYGSVQLRLCCTPSRSSLMFSDTPHSDKVEFARWITELEAKGYAFDVEGRGDRHQLRDTPAARQLILEQIKVELPSSTILKLESRISRSGNFVIDYVSIFVRDLIDIEKLDLPDLNEK